AGFIETEALASVQVDKARRQGAMRNHTGTHLLHAALRHVLGDGVHQTGSYVGPDRLRFDFSYPIALTADQLQAVENLVNGWILSNLPVTTRQMPREQAIAGGAMAFFEEKYGEVVRVVTVPSASQELCGGTHCAGTGDIGMLAITQEESVGSGNRRIEAVTGWGALQLLQEQRSILNQLQQEVKGSTKETLPERVQGLLEENRRQTASISALQHQSRMQYAQNILSKSHQIGSHQVLVTQVDQVASVEELRDLLDGLKMAVDIAVLAAQIEDKAAVIVSVRKTAASSIIKANDLIRQLAPYIDGGGGGREDLAQAGGKNVEGIGALLEAARQILAARLTAAG
ncbi:MAG: DHHA1 domain-containing protein, partial [Firmicutes bacterium]|nr:DHHA1 domain-containing protein [Bacillota bacterium]